MAKATLKSWRRESILVEIESTEPLTKEEEEEVSGGIRTAFAWILAGEPIPSLDEVKQAIQGSNPDLAKKITKLKYY